MIEILSPASITRLYEPSPCERRVWLHDVENEPACEDNPFQEFIKTQGNRHEDAVKDGMERAGMIVEDIDGYKNPRALAQTIAGIQAGGMVIYQGILESKLKVAGELRTVIGYPDFLSPRGDAWVISDAKLTRRLFDDGDAERREKKSIFLQMRLYGLLFEAMFPGTPFSLEVHNGAGSVDEVEMDSGEGVLAELERIVEIRSRKAEPPALVGWSRCGPCGYRHICWPIALETEALGLVYGIDTRLAPKLEAKEIFRYPEVAELSPEELAAIKARNGADVDGSRAIIENVQSLLAGEPIRRRDAAGAEVPIDPALSSDSNYVMFDVEGLPPHLNEQEKIYLWGLKVVGEQEGEFIPCLADFGPGGDEKGWREFLARSREILDENPGIRFVHWHDYDRRMVGKYLKRYKDDAYGTAAQILKLTLDLLPITRDSVAIPAHSYSLKVVEALDDVKEKTGFERRADDVTKGDQSIAAFMDAVETEDMARRAEIIQALCDYNEEDLDAMWAVQQWLQTLARGD